ncbi:hypothetical protein HDV05_003872 [Chytridiales sp. JEL 0842]|nr:hypothetical protein HDV05_003872 [Chytridiales sp. JEL 0842]
MCGRTVIALAPEDLQARVRAQQWRNRDEYRPSYNIGPGRSCPVLIQTSRRGGRNVGGGGQSDSGRELVNMRWGFIPPQFTQKPDFQTIIRTINARDDSIKSNAPTWSRARQDRRCVVPIQGFYEWLKKGKDRKPFYIIPKKAEGATEKELGEPPILYVAGLWNISEIDSETIYSFTIVTTDSSPDLKWLHDRMPVILRTPEEVETWLDPDVKFGTDVGSLMRPFEDGLEWYAVSPAVNKSDKGNDGPQCIVPISQAKGTLASFFSKAPPATSTTKKEDLIEKKEGASNFEADTDCGDADKKVEALEQGSYIDSYYTLSAQPMDDTPTQSSTILSNTTSENHSSRDALIQKLISANLISDSIDTSEIPLEILQELSDSLPPSSPASTKPTPKEAPSTKKRKPDDGGKKPSTASSLKNKKAKALSGKKESGAGGGNSILQYFSKRT